MSVSAGRKTPAAKAVFSLFSCLCLALLLFPVLGCQTEADDDSGIGLNPKLIGTWALYSYETTDVYVISSATLSHHSYSSYRDPNLSGTIVSGYSFDPTGTAGCLIVKRKDDKFTAVYYKDLDNPKDTVVLGDAYTASDYNIDPAVDSLKEAIEKFTGESKDSYGAGLSGAGKVQRIDW
jgi:hypothetical protein